MRFSRTRCYSSSCLQRLLGGDGLPRLTIATEDQKREKQLVDHETLSIRTYGPVLHTILMRILGELGPDPR